MKHEYPEDEFDHVSRDAKIGAHRSTRPHVALWKALLAGLIAVVVIVGAAFVYLQFVRGNNAFTESVNASASGTAGAIDKSTPVTVLAVANASASAAAAETLLQQDGWKQLTSATAEGTSVPSTTTVIVSEQSLLAAGQAIVKALGAGQAGVTTDSPRPITVSIGSDFHPSASGTKSSTLSGSPSASASTSASTASRSASASASSSPSASVDKSTRVAVLNATSTHGLAARRAATLRSDGWTVGAVTNAPSRSSTSAVHYRSASDRASARAVARALGISRVTRDSAFSAPITVVLGADQS